MHRQGRCIAEPQKAGRPHGPGKTRERVRTPSTGAHPKCHWRLREVKIFPSTALRTSPSTARRTAAPTAQQCRRTRTTRAVTSSLTTPRGGATAPPRRAQPLLLLSVCCLDPIPPTGGGGRKATACRPQSPCYGTAHIKGVTRRHRVSPARASKPLPAFQDLYGRE